MLASLRAWGDRLLGRGSAAITVPVMDGALKANRALDEAEIVATIEGLDDLASNGQTLWASAGPVLWQLRGNTLTEARRFDADISAIAAHPGGRVAVALDGRRVELGQIGVDGNWRCDARLDGLAGRALKCVNAMSFDGDDLLLTEGSAEHGPGDWSRDLMTLGQGGRVGRWDGRSSSAEPLAVGLHYAFGVLAQPGGALVSESWRHRVVAAAGGDRLAELPAYPSRMAAARGGGYWLSCFAGRTQLVEFVLREPAYRRRMVAEIDPRYWIAPALSSGTSFLEPLQGAGVKQMGVLKPWAPPRSYGLVLRIGADGQVLSSLHSQVDGHHHGITAVAELGGDLYAASKGSGRLLRVGGAAR